MPAKAPTRRRQRDVVQVKNPRSRRYVKIDRSAGVIVSTKKSPGPYKGVPIAARHGVGHPVGVDEADLILSGKKIIILAGAKKNKGVGHPVGVDKADLILSGKKKIIIREGVKKNI